MQQQGILNYVKDEGYADDGAGGKDVFDDAKAKKYRGKLENNQNVNKKQNPFTTSKIRAWSDSANKNV